MDLDVPQQVDASALGRRLQAIGEELQVDVSFGANAN
jgi:glycine cleavage system regulatory protein